MKCATCEIESSNEYFTCSHNFLGYGFQKKGERDNYDT